MIPFIQGLEDGKRLAVTVNRPGHIETLAADFIEAGGRYLLETVAEGQVHIMAIIDTASGQCEKVAEETVPNGRELPKAIDRLVTASHKHMPPFVSEIKTRLILPTSKMLEDLIVG